MSNKVSFNAPRTRYDEAKGRERYLEYLKSAQRVSELKQQALLNEKQGVYPQVQERTTSEILTDEAEASRLLQEYIGQLVQRPDGRPKLSNENDDFYAQRTNPIAYVLDNLNMEEKYTLLTNFSQIKDDLKGVAGKMIPRDLIIYLDNYDRLRRESGGVSRFNVSSVILDELRGIRREIATPMDIQNLENTINVLRTDIDRDRTLSRTSRTNVDRMINEIMNRLDLLNTAVNSIDYNALEQSITSGVQDVLEGDRVRQESIYQQLNDRLDQMPSRQELIDANEVIRRELEDVQRTTIFSFAENERWIQATLRSVNDILSAVNVNQMEELFKLLNEIYLSTNIQIAQVKTIDSNEQKNIASIRKQVRQELGMNERGPISREVKEKYDMLVEQRIAEMSKSTEPLQATALPLQEMSEDRKMTPEEQIREQVRKAKEMAKRFGSFGSTFSEEKEGKGIKMIRTKGRNFKKIVGKGIELPEQKKTYLEFGKYALSIPALENNVLTAKYIINGATIPSLPSQRITEKMSDLLQNFIDTQHLDKKQFDKLEHEDKKLFLKLMKGSGLNSTYDIKIEKPKEEQEEEERFELVKGIYIAGNDNPKIKEELKHFIIKFMNDGRLPKKQALDLLITMSI